MSDFAVRCPTCSIVVYEGDTAPEDGQVLLTNYGNSTCPRTDCPHKTAAIEAGKSKRPVSRAELLELDRRLTAVERKVGL